MSVTKIALSVLVLLLATAAGVYLTLAASDATFAEMHSNTNGKNPVLRYLAHGEIRAREKKQEEAHHTIFTEKKSKHVHNDTLPPASLTKASSSSRGVINWSLRYAPTNRRRHNTTTPELTSFLPSPAILFAAVRTRRASLGP